MLNTSGLLVASVERRRSGCVVSNVGGKVVRRACCHNRATITQVVAAGAAVYVGDQRNSLHVFSAVFRSQFSQWQGIHIVSKHAINRSLQCTSIYSIKAFVLKERMASVTHQSQMNLIVATDSAEQSRHGPGV